MRLEVYRNFHVWLSESHVLIVNMIHPFFNDIVGLLYFISLTHPSLLVLQKNSGHSFSWEARLSSLKPPRPLMTISEIQPLMPIPALLWPAGSSEES